MISLINRKVICAQIQYSVLYVLFFTHSFLISQINYKHYTVKDGLPHDFTYQIYEDEKGYIWFGTDDGLTKYNGTNFKVFDRRNGFGTDFIIDLRKYNGDTLVTAVWKSGLHFMVNDSAYKAKKHENSNDFAIRIHNVYPLKQDIFATTFGLHNYYQKQSDKSFKQYFLAIVTNQQGVAYLTDKPKPRKTTFNITSKIDNTIYFYRGFHSQEDKKIFRGIYEFISTEKKIKLVFPFLKDKYINAFGKYGSNMFYATQKDSLFVFDKNKIIKRKKYDVNGIIHQYTNTGYCEVLVVNDRESKYDIVYVYDKRKKQRQTFSEQIGSGTKVLVSDLFVDTQENIWITSKADGIYKISKIELPYQETLLENNYISDIAIGNNDTYFFLTDKKLYGYQKDKNTTKAIQLHSDAVRFRNYNSNKKNEINIKYQKQIFDTINFLNHSINSTWNKISNDSIILEYKSNSINYKLNGILKTIDLTKNQLNSRINNFIIVKNEIWVLTNKGVFIYNINNKIHNTYDKWILKNNNVSKIQHTLKNDIYAVTPDGLIYRSDNNKQIVKYDKENGLDSSKINDIFLDHHNILWIATQKGFSILKNDMFYNYSTTNGFPSTFASKIKEDKEDQIWIAGNKGVIRIDNTEPYSPHSPPILYIKKQDTKFFIDIIDYRNYNNITEYRSKIGGKWKNIGDGVIDVSDYVPGEYDIQFRARNDLSSWVYSKNYPYYVSQLWYKTIWFYLSCIIVIFFLVNYRIRSISKRNRLLKQTIAQSAKLEQELSKVRENVAQDFHDELGNKLAGITVLSELMVKNKELQQTKAAEMALQVQKDAKDLYFGIKDFVWSIDSKSDDLKELMIYLTDFGEELFSNKGITFRVEKHLDIDNRKLPYYWSRQLLLLFKETMTNTLKHAEATEATLIFSVKKNILKITFSDNGIGFDPATLKRKNGLLNIKKRVDTIQGKLEIASKNGTKTIFTGKMN